MKRLDNIGNFFRKRLIETEPIELEWNVPSDDIWLAAEPHFPKEKQKRRWLVIFFFVGVCILSSVSIMRLNSTSNKISDGANEMAVDVESTIKLDNENQNLNENQDVSQNQNLNENQNGNGSIVKSEEEKISLENKVLISKDISSSQNRIEVARFDDLRNDLISISKVIEDDLNSDAKLGSFKNEIINESMTASNPLDEQNESSILNPNSKDRSLLNKSELLNILTLPKQKLFALQFSENCIISKSPSIIEIGENRINSRWEVGFALSQFIRKPDWIIEDLLDEDDNYDLQSKQLGFNLSLTKLVSDRFSYTTGLIFNNLDFDLNITDVQTFGDDVTIAVLKKRIQDFVKVGNLSINGNGRDINIEFLSENDLRKGDLLNLSAEFPINIQLYQLPFILNYRFIKNKWEWNASGGISLDIVSIKVNDIKVDVVKDGVTVINPVEVDPISDLSLTGSLYLGSGIKYEIYPKLSVGLQSRVDITELKLSKYELGLFYKL